MKAALALISLGAFSFHTKLKNFLPKIDVQIFFKYRVPNDSISLYLFY